MGDGLDAGGEGLLEVQEVTWHEGVDSTTTEVVPQDTLAHDSLPADACVPGPTTDCCAVDGECDDLDPCTVDTCADGSCLHALLEWCVICGDGTCDEGEAGSCPFDCEGIEAGCLPGAEGQGGGCGGCACEACVCAIVPECCEVAWLPQCALLCKDYCGSCGGPSSCGDGICDTSPYSYVQETCSTCEDDCGPCAACGDGTCGAGETCHGCPEDCGACQTAACGDDVCTPWEETCYVCPHDCGTCSGCSVSPVPGCGEKCWCKDAVCAVEPSCCTEAWSITCVALCLQMGNCGGEVCGDGVCGGNEEAAYCPEDCGSCGDSLCSEVVEIPWCPDDCPTCGDGACGPGESEWSCPKDCTSG